MSTARPSNGGVSQERSFRLIQWKMRGSMKSLNLQWTHKQSPFFLIFKISIITISRQQSISDAGVTSRVNPRLYSLGFCLVVVYFFLLVSAVNCSRLPAGNLSVIVWDYSVFLVLVNFSHLESPVPSSGTENKKKGWIIRQSPIVAYFLPCNHILRICEIKRLKLTLTPLRLRNLSGNLLSFVKGQHGFPVLTEVRLQCKSMSKTAKPLSGR